MPFYAVKKGKKPGVYEKWNDCQQQTIGFHGAQFKKFDTREEAESFVSGTNPGKTASTKAATGKRGAASKSKREDSASESEESESDQESDDSEDESVPSKKAKTSNQATSKGAGGEQVYVDGCSFNLGKQPVAGVGIYWGKDSPNNLSEPLAISGKITLNRALIHAAIRVVNQIKKLGKSDVTINNDNSNLIQSMSSWVSKWKSNGWKTNAGTDVANKEDYQELAKAAEGLQISWNLAGADADEQKHADKLANEGARKKS
ncbi:ribonuclease H1-like [Paramacrobiotus metropolitanus]|uniref:ribonuclease H1-like n=1 Tax=Paramacrobiotus metropolitanus TaxID=2943436 RepID=UPI0024456EAC|nr:ribonuclease H1-like [Paramacrobiotus metropolitanus]XP_055329059.1 ribonuclease H1-like [Paramacrobiotus metropolitanus]XP_055329060.1 ribonuclease H1-like [Paramacrobiotus metropolitanus]XP_055329061.1 ribonuclease H1-like [Paramacrobiotus metropolitanus]